MIIVENPNDIKWSTSLENAAFINQHPKYKDYFYLNALNEETLKLIKNSLGDRDIIPIYEIDTLNSLLKEANLDLAYIGDPYPLERLVKLDNPYPFPINITLYPFQTQGFNYVKDLQSCIMNWSTGAGKTAWGVIQANYLLKTNKVSKVIVASRNHNKTNWQRQFKKIVDLDSTVVHNISKSLREDLYKEEIVIVNYEKFRETIDGSFIQSCVKKQNVFYIFDEMPMMLKNPKTQTYKGVQAALRASVSPRKAMLSATPVENTPEDVYHCMKLIDASVFSTVKSFRDDYAKTRNPWAKWKVTSWDNIKLKDMGMRLSHLTHVVDKQNNPIIKKQFPIEQWEDIYIDMSSEDRKVYHAVEAEIQKLALDKNINYSEFLPLQLVCNNPILLQLSTSEIAQQIKSPLVDKNCQKLQVLKELIEQIDGKIVVFSMYNKLGSQMLQYYISTWGYNSVLYQGRQDTEDAFRDDPNIKVFVSSDKGSDSINLERASTVINYDFPWKWTTLIQRVNRINRLSSTATHTTYYNLINVDTIEERKQQIISKKKSFQDLTFGSIEQDLDSISQQDLSYILSG